MKKILNHKVLGVGIRTLVVRPLNKILFFCVSSLTKLCFFFINGGIHRTDCVSTSVYTSLHSGKEYWNGQFKSDTIISYSFDFIKKVPIVYTHSKEIIFLSLVYTGSWGNLFQEIPLSKKSCFTGFYFTLKSSSQYYYYATGKKT